MGLISSYHDHDAGVRCGAVLPGTSYGVVLRAYGLARGPGLTLLGPALSFGKDLLTGRFDPFGSAKVACP